MKVLEVAQGSLEWLAARAGVVTASEIDALVSPLWKIRESKGVDTYIAQKIAERWNGGSISNFQTLDMEFGQILENEAIPAYEFEFNQPITRVGLILDDAGQIGCSPDGLIGADGGIEVKCPQIHTHVKYLLADQLPPEYAAQVQFSLYVTGRSYWQFMSYNRSLPRLIKRIEPDAKAQAAFASVIPDFIGKLNEAWKKLCELNGSEPTRNSFREEIINKPQQSQNEIIP